MALRSLDHCVISVDDLDDAGRNYECLGFHVLPRMKHIEIGTSNRVIQFEHTYLEFIGDLASSPPLLKDRMLPRFEAGEGLSIVSLTSNDLAADHESLAAAGFEPDPIISARRKIIMPDGSEDETASSCFYVWRAGKEYLTLFFSQHLKPETIFVPAYYDAHPNGVTGVSGIRYVSADPAADRDYFSAMFRREPLIDEPGHLAYRGDRGDRTEIYSPDRLRDTYPLTEWPAEFALSGYPVGLELRVRSTAQTRRVLAGNGVRTIETGNGSTFVTPAFANGVLLEFVE